MNVLGIPVASGAAPTFGGLWLWGRNTEGALGDNTTIHRSSPVLTVAGGTNWNTPNRLRTNTASIKTDGTLWVWGKNDLGQLGDNTQIQRNSPIQTVSGGTNWSKVFSNRESLAAIKTDGTLWLWGRNAFGQLGDTTIIHRSSPIQTVAGGTNWTEFTGSLSAAAAIKTDGTLWTWGNNSVGQLADNSTINQFSPIQTIAGGTTWNKVSSGSNHFSATKTDGTLWTWGYNNYGQLGDNTLIARSSPVQTITGGSNWSQVSAGDVNLMAIKTDGTLWGWGRGASGQLGDNAAINRSSPVQTITGGSNWSQVSAGGYHTAATKTDGTLWVWGSNSYGQLADNTIIDKSSPVQTVMSGTNWISATAGLNHTAAIKSV
jgi:alpha-tubulin suppressor-like RCC1 family protein